MSNAIVKFLLVFLAGLVVTFAFTWLVSKGHKQYFRHSVAQVEEIYNDKDFYDIVYIGSSRTHTTINPAIVDSITGLRSYNAAVEGGNLYEFKMNFDGYLQSHPQPKMVVLTL